MLDGNELKFGDLLVEKGKECNKASKIQKVSADIQERRKKL